MSKAVVKPPAKKEAAEAMKLIEEARSSFSFMQRSWFNFAKAVYMIKTSEMYSKAGIASTFQEYVEKEFPTVSLTTMSKFTSIIESWGDTIEARFKKDDSYVLPAYDSCYDLVAREDRIPKEEFSKMKKAVLDNKMTLTALRERLKEYVKVHKAKAKKEFDDEVEKIHDEFEKEVQRDLDHEEQEFMEDDDDIEPDLLASPEELDFDEDDDSERDEDEEVTIVSVHTRVEFLVDAVPELKSQLKSMKFSKQLVALTNDLSSLRDQIDEFLTKMEEKRDEQAVSKAERRA